MRNDETHWDRSYKEPPISAKKIAKELKARRRGFQTGRARENAERWDRDFSLDGDSQVRPAKTVHPDDKARGIARRGAEEKYEDRQLAEELKEVWE